MVKEAFKFGVGFGLGRCAALVISYAVAHIVVTVYDEYHLSKEKDHLPDKNQKD